MMCGVALLTEFCYPALPPGGLLWWHHLVQGTAELLPFDPFTAQPKMSYKDGCQKKYFVLESFEVGGS